MNYIITALVSFVAGLVVARIYWGQIIAWGKAEEAKLKAAVQAKFDPSRPTPPPAG
jgi:hypothetical protein